MDSRYSSDSSRLSGLASRARRLFARGWRPVLCLVLIAGLFILPDAGYAVSAATEVAVNAAKETVAPVPAAYAWLRRLLRRPAGPQQQEGFNDRLAQLARLQVSPHKFVGYVGQTVSFSALPLNSNGDTIQGLRCDWLSSDSDKVTVDDAGRATLLKPGLVRITAQAGSVQSSVALKVKSGSRGLQSDTEWQEDQQSLSDNPVGMDSSVERFVAGLADRLAPTASAQVVGSADLAYDEMWSEPRNLTGNPRNRTAESTRTGTVLPEGSNFNFSTSIVSLGGRGVGTSLALAYNSRVWSRRNNKVAFDAITSWPGPGFSLGFGRVVVYNTAGAPSSPCQLMWVAPDGTRHYLGTGVYGTSSTYSTNDGSHIHFTGSARFGGTLMFNDGSSVQVSVVNNRLQPTQYLDLNGNYIQITYKDSTLGYSPMAIDYITDTLGRVIQFNYNGSFQLTSITAPGYGGTASSPVTQTLVQFDYQTVTANGTFSGLTVERSAGTITTLKHVYFPATGTGYMPSFTAYGTLSGMSARRQMTFGAGVIHDGVQSNNVGFNYPTTGPLTDAPGFTQRTESATNAPTATYSYASSTDAVAQTMTFTITRPDSSTLNLTRSTNTSIAANGLLAQSETKAGGGASMTKSVLSYVNDPGGEPQVANVITSDDATPTANQTKVDYDYDSYGNMTNKREYGYQVSGSWAVRRRTHNVYKTDASYVNNGLRNLVTEIDVYDGQLDTNDANDVLVAKATYTYDDYAAMGGMETYTGQPTAPGHLSWYDATWTVRGNVTGTTQWYDIANNLSYNKLRKIDMYGNAIKEQLSCCNEQTITATQTNYWAVPEQITKGAAGGPQLTTSRAYDFNTSVVNSATDADNLTTVTSYDAALRPAVVTLPTTATATTTYNDGSLTASRSLNYDDGGTTKTVTEAADYDGWGRVINQLDANGGNIHTWYDAMGRVQYVSNPYATGGTVYETSYVYDAMGRKTQAVLPDFQTVTTTYNGNTVTVTDQVNRKTQRVMDGLGRLVTVNEQDASGNLTQATNYTYDTLDDLSQVDQGGQLRQYKYDALGRMAYEKIPEQTASINDGTGTLWTCKYTYNDSNQVVTHTDARGVVTTNTYDTLNRLQQVSYGAVSGVTTAPTITYTYDHDASYGTTANGVVVRVNVGSDYQERYTFDANFRIASVIRTIGARTYTTAYNSYNEADQVTQMTYPSGQALYVRHDSSGRLSGLSSSSVGGTSYLGSVTYDAAGHLTGDTLANGVAEQFGYDAQRMQLTSQKAGTASPYTNRMNLTYSYSATSGQMGVGSTAGNAGQLMSVSGTINGATESAAYTYDNYSRLVTSNQTSNGGSAQRRFAYDRWGNRTGVWDATSGGTQIQSVALVNSAGIPSNRISGVTTTGTVSYSYDANGNVTNDGAHSYTYDSESRLVSVDAGSTASYGYDHQNRRYKKTVGSAVTHYVWEGNQVLAEHNGGTGAMQVNYIYSGTRLVAKNEAGTFSYLLSDPLSVRASLDASGAVVGQQGYLPFGEDFAESGAQQKQHLTSYERDSETGTDYALNRQYNQSVGRFNRVDPYNGSYRLKQPQSLNRYSYVNNNPVNAIDRLGLLLECSGWGSEAELPECDDDGSGNFPGERGDGNRGSGDGGADRFKPDGERDCKKFVNWLIDLAEAYNSGEDLGRSGMGAQLGSWAVDYQKSDPTDGFQKALHEPLQHGEMYKHLLAFIGLTLVANFAPNDAARLAARYTMEQALLTDEEQVARGRAESQAELADDYAGMSVGDLLTRRFRNEIDSSQLRQQLRSTLCKKGD